MASRGIQSVDATGPLSSLATGGADVAAGAEVTLIASNAARVKVTLCHAGTAGTVWIGVGQTATANSGLYLQPGDVWEEFFAGAVHVRNAGTGSVRMTWMEWGA